MMPIDRSEYELPAAYPARFDEMSDAELEFRGWSRTDLIARWEKRLTDDLSTPAPGQVAPDFALERLSPSGQRSGEMLELSSLRGKPVGLIFGSYT
jgi:hypothetical protein